MNIQEELNLFKRYSSVFRGESNAVIAISSVHLAEQLKNYISPSLDVGWIIGCILDINSENLFSNVRKTGEEVATLPNNSAHPEYKYASLIIKLCYLFWYLSESKEMTKEEVEEYVLTKDSEFYFGETLSELNRKLISLACPEMSLAQ